MYRIMLTTIVLAIIATPQAHGVSYPSGSDLASRSDFTPIDREPLALPQTSAPVFGPPRSLIPVFLHNVNTRQNRLFILTREGEIVGDDAAALEEFFRCKRSGRSHPMSTEVLSIVAEIAAEYPGHVLEIVSGFRRPGFGVKGSKHYSGNAIDLRVRGVATRKVRDFVWLGQNEEMGLGHYTHENFIHVDHRRSEPKVAWTQRRRNSPYRFNPRWAKVAVADSSAETTIARN